MAKEEKKEFENTLEIIKDLQTQQLEISKENAPIIKALNHNSTKTANAVVGIDKSIRILAETNKLSEENNRMLLKSNISWGNVAKIITLITLIISVGFVSVVAGTACLEFVLKILGIWV